MIIYNKRRLNSFFKRKEKLSEFQIADLLAEYGIEISNDFNITDKKIIAGKNLALMDNKLYSTDSVLSNLPVIIEVNSDKPLYSILSNIKSLYNIIDVEEDTDFNILNTYYRDKLSKEYKLLKLALDTNKGKYISTTLELFQILGIFSDCVEKYKQLYKLSEINVDKYLAFENLMGVDYIHSYLGINENGIPTISVIKNELQDGTLKETYNVFELDIRSLDYLMDKETLNIPMTKEHLLFSNNKNLLSGFDKDSDNDLMICEHLYNIDSQTKEGVSKNLKWYALEMQ